MSSRLKQGFVDRLQRSWTLVLRKFTSCLTPGFVVQRKLYLRDPFFMRGVQMSEVEFALVKWNDETSGPWACLASECTQAYRECEVASFCLGNDVEDSKRIVQWNKL